jgi:hypothetical protein
VRLDVYANRATLRNRYIDRNLISDRLAALLSGLFGSLALVLAGLGSSASLPTRWRGAGRKSASGSRSARRRRVSCVRCCSASCSSIFGLSYIPPQA